MKSTFSRLVNLVKNKISFIRGYRIIHQSVIDGIRHDRFHEGMDFMKRKMRGRSDMYARLGMYYHSNEAQRILAELEEANIVNKLTI